MKALSIRQPWANLIVKGTKTIEIRKWKTKHRGDLLIHAGLTVCKTGRQLFSPETLCEPLGVIIGIAELVDVKYYETLDEISEDFKKHLNPLRWFPEESEHRSVYGFVLENAGPVIPPIPYKGQLSLFETFGVVLND